MKRFISLFLVLMAPSVFALSHSGAGMTGNYTVLVEENGDAQVILDINGSGTINLPLPLDVVSPSVEGALYIQARNGIDLSVGSGGAATVSYGTSLLTVKDAGIWEFEMTLPDLYRVYLSLNLPQDIEVMETIPQAWIAQGTTATRLLWDITSPENETVLVRYRYVEAAMPETSPPPLINTSGESQATEPSENASAGGHPKQGPGDTGEGGSLSGGPGLLPLLVAAALLSLSAYVYLIKKGRRTGQVTSDGKKSILQTLTANEHAIVTALLRNGGGMKRNRLERETALAKSSLASSLYRLEERNIVEVDKSGAVHYVRLTDWFQSL